jgi:hypothetical protein
LLLNAAASHVLDTAVLRPGDEILVEGGPLMEVVRVAEPSAHLFAAVEFYGPGIQALQLAWADDRGQWPWDAGFRGHKGGQPVLGLRTILRTGAA